MNKPTLEQIEKVAEWWAVRTFDKAWNQDNGDNSETGRMTFLLMNMASNDAYNKAPKGARDKFINAIVESLSSISKEYQGEYTLSVDYDPNVRLGDVCEKAGIGSRMLPCKTFTLWHHDEKKFRGRHTYGGPWEDVA
jgi:hypothetical protein